MVEVSQRYSNLEFDLEEGRRGSRYSHVEEISDKNLPAPKSALVVNNNAAAVYLSLQTHALGKEVIVSRGQLVEIGGSFRIPDVMARSGAMLVEVGATNKTHLHGITRTPSPKRPGMLLKVHTSNFQIVGFTAEVPLEELVKLGREHDIPVMEDLGSGCFLDLSRYGLKREPTVQETMRAGADICHLQRRQTAGRAPGRTHSGEGRIHRSHQEKSRQPGFPHRQTHAGRAGSDAHAVPPRRRRHALNPDAGHDMRVPRNACNRGPAGWRGGSEKRWGKRASGNNGRSASGSAAARCPSRTCPPGWWRSSPAVRVRGQIGKAVAGRYEIPVICRIEQEKALYGRAHDTGRRIPDYRTGV